MQPILECCCGIDVHRDMIEACIIKGIEEPVLMRETFSTYPHELKRFVEWLYANNCYHVAMESTGVYWRPVYEAIEEFSPYYEHIIVANAHHMRNLPGRKTDVKDAEWIATLLQHGLLEPSFVPERIILDLREFSRTYKNCVSEKTPPAFIWHTESDASVPVQNSRNLAHALEENAIKHELVLFPEGYHGLSLATHETCHDIPENEPHPASVWVELADKWLKNL